MNVRSISRLWFLGAILALGTSVAMAGASTVDVSNARIRLLPGDLPLAGYFDMHNSGKKAISLTSASSPAFGMVMIHKSMHKNGEAMMMMVKKIEVAPGKTVSFAPGGYHLMLMHRKKDLKVGDKVMIELVFSNGHKMDVQFKVGEAGTE
jgi:copper(I)-binding protein